MKICAIIPAHNEEATIGSIIKETRKYVDQVFVVDDASTDNTAKVALQHNAQVIQHTINQGQGGALQTAYDIAVLNLLDNVVYEYIVQLDADGQHDPQYIPEMLKMAQSCDIVIGSRFLNESYKEFPFIRKIGIVFFSQLVNLLTRAGITDVTSGYRVYRTETLKKLNPLTKRNWAIETTLEAAVKGMKIKEVSVEMPVRNLGKSQFSFKKYVTYPYKVIWAMIKIMIFK